MDKRSFLRYRIRRPAVAASRVLRAPGERNLKTAPKGEGAVIVTMTVYTAVGTVRATRSW